MAGQLTFHNKYHRANHHTLSSFDIVDSGFDPIASKNYPFLGLFYNTLTDQDRTYNIDTNSFEWWSAYTTFRTYSANWMNTLTLFTTVCSLSNRWELGYESYLNSVAFSGRWETVYATVCGFSAFWGSPYLMFTNVAQEYTHSKTFSGQDLGVDANAFGLSSYVWNLDDQQVAYLTLTGRSFLNNPEDGTLVNGGIYTLVVKQRNDADPHNTHELLFDTQYRFNDRSRLNDIVLKSLSAITLINFIAIDGLLYGDVTQLSAN